FTSPRSAATCTSTVTAAPATPAAATFLSTLATKGALFARWATDSPPDLRKPRTMAGLMIVFGLLQVGLDELGHDLLRSRPRDPVPEVLLGALRAPRGEHRLRRGRPVLAIDPRRPDLVAALHQELLEELHPL